uniref:SFRICE_026168 n=1 Tax=Spodoptera frugiperda TaxID=7108 RepID=A0A2H1W2B2_SPOFR
MSGRSDCRKFAPNIFNKSKCTNCFRQKEEHSAEALESNRRLHQTPCQVHFKVTKNKIRSEMIVNIFSPPDGHPKHQRHYQCVVGLLEAKNLRHDDGLTRHFVNFMTEYTDSDTFTALMETKTPFRFTVTPVCDLLASKECSKFK